MSIASRFIVRRWECSAPLEKTPHKDTKYGREMDNSEWVKVHMMCGVKTLIVSSVAKRRVTSASTTSYQAELRYA